MILVDANLLLYAINSDLAHLEQGYAVYSADYDFQRFTGLKHINPLA